MTRWRWDQGRTDYFQFDELQKFAPGLVAFDGHALPQADDPDTLREILEQYSDLPFAAPPTYKAWRNYKRVFGCLLLATEVNRIVRSTELASELASGKLDSDTYLTTFAQRFYFSSPVFDDYNPTEEQIFPACAIVKFLIARFVFNDKKFVSIEEIIDFVVGNSLTGDEPLSSYGELDHSGYVSTNTDEVRQIREMVKFISQLNFLKWHNPYVYLDIDTKEDAIEIAKVFQPIKTLRSTTASTELLQLGRKSDAAITAKIEIKETSPEDIEFIEGSKVRSSHLRIERSSKLREFYYQNVENPNLCNMCETDQTDKYPWATRIIELHHLLPLASPVRVEKEASSLKDIVGLCPSCHRATHKFYSKWFKDNEQSDFKSYDEAKSVYLLAKSKINL